MAELQGIGMVTGAGSGIGQAVAIAMVRAGCKGLALLDQNTEGLEQTREKIAKVRAETEVLLVAGNIAEPDFINQALDVLLTKFGRLDHAVNSAGVFGPAATSVEVILEEADRVMNINYRGIFLCARAEIKAMLRNERSDPGDVPGQRGSIVNIASNLAFMAKPGSPSLAIIVARQKGADTEGTAAYCASKGAVVSLTKADATDFAGDGIRVNCVCPGLTETPLATFNNNAEIIKALDVVVQRVPMKRWAKPREIADAALFLLSNRASFIQGQALCVDGGYSIN